MSVYNFLNTSVENAESTFKYLLSTQSRANQRLANEVKGIKHQIEVALWGGELTKEQAKTLLKRIEKCDFENIVKIRRGIKTNGKV